MVSDSRNLSDKRAKGTFMEGGGIQSDFPDLVLQRWFVFITHQLASSIFRLNRADSPFHSLFPSSSPEYVDHECISPKLCKVTSFSNFSTPPRMPGWKRTKFGVESLVSPRPFHITMVCLALCLILVLRNLRYGSPPFSINCPHPTKLHDQWPDIIPQCPPPVHLTNPFLWQPSPLAACRRFRKESSAVLTSSMISL